MSYLTRFLNKILNKGLEMKKTIGISISVSAIAIFIITSIFYLGVYKNKLTNLEGNSKDIKTTLTCIDGKIDGIGNKIDNTNNINVALYNKLDRRIDQTDVKIAVLECEHKIKEQEKKKKKEKK